MFALITGVAGFVGSSLAERLLADGWRVRGVDCFVDYYPKARKEQHLKPLMSDKNFEFLNVDLSRAEIEPLLKDCEVIFHQAGQAGVRASWGEYFSSYTRHNIEVTQRLLEALKRTPKRLVYASSSSVYGNAERYPTAEDVLPQPVSPYGVTKLGAEHLVSLYASQFGVPGVSLRYFTVFGPKQRPDMAFDRFIRSALDGREISIFGDGEQSRDFTFVSDIVNANILAASKGESGGVFNVGGGTNATVNQVLAILEREIGPIKRRHQEAQLGEARKTSADTTRAREILGFKPEVSLEQGLKLQIEWIKQHRE